MGKLAAVHAKLACSRSKLVAAQHGSQPGLPDTQAGPDHAVAEQEDSWLVLDVHVEACGKWRVACHVHAAKLYAAVPLCLLRVCHTAPSLVVSSVPVL